IKESEEKLIEAKWIYLQAIDVATIHKDERGLAVSLYNLAELKTMIGDASLAIADYKRARDLASRNKMNALLVEIEDGLGDAYLDSGDYKEAARSEEHTSELQSRENLVCRLLHEKKNYN